ncbi:hypothetical protein, partial [Asticcacaulis sp.]|uniref:hypothetical protein n=1 Tax=Asticcacaulis sp. TaxID=1872648 RepID=UPI0026103B22
RGAVGAKRLGSPVAAYLARMRPYAKGGYGMTGKREGDGDGWRRHGRECRSFIVPINNTIDAIDRG